MRSATGHLHTPADRSLCESLIVMLQSVNGDECETQTDREGEPEAFTEEMGKAWNQMDNCKNTIIIHIAMQHADMLQVADERKYRYLLCSYFPRGTRRSFFKYFFLILAICRQGSWKIVVRNGRRTGGGGVMGTDIPWRLIEVSEPCSPPKWKPSPGSLLCHLAYDSPIKPMYLSACHQCQEIWR